MRCLNLFWYMSECLLRADIRRGVHLLYTQALVEIVYIRNFVTVFWANFHLYLFCVFNLKQVLSSQSL